MYIHIYVYIYIYIRHRACRGGRLMRVMGLTSPLPDFLVDTPWESLPGKASLESSPWKALPGKLSLERIF